MNKVFQVNIGGVPFTINEDGFAQLNRYLDSLKAMFNGDQSHEIMQDIESRIAELLTERMQKRLIIELSDIQFVMEVIGSPEDLSDEDTSDPKDQKQQSKSAYEFKTGKRLYRNPDEKVIAGVASGIAAFLGIRDPLWVRLAFIILAFFSRGIAVIGYIVLMFILKEAKSSKEKLEMRGDPINLANLSKMVEDEVNGFTGKFKKFKKKDKRNTQDNATADVDQEEEGWHSKIEDWLMNLGQSVEYGMRGVLRVIAPIVKLTGGVILLVLVMVWVGILFSLVVGKPVIMMFMPADNVVSFLGMCNAYAILLIPIIAIALLVVRWFFKKRIHSAILGGLFGFWFISLMSLAIVSSKVAKEFSTPFTVFTNMIQNKDQRSAYHIQVDKVKSEYAYQLGNFSFNNQNLKLGPTKLVLEKSDDEYYYLLQEMNARGRDEQAATLSASEMNFNFSVKNDTIIIPESAKLPIDSKFRNQTLSYTLKIPENKSVHFDKDLGKMVIVSRIPGAPVYNSALRNKTLTLVKDSLRVTPNN